MKVKKMYTLDKKLENEQSILRIRDFYGKKINPTYILNTNNIDNSTKKFAFSLKNSYLSVKKIEVAKSVLKSILENPFAESIEICKRLKLTKEELKECYLIIQKTNIAQKILESCFPRHYSFFRDRILFNFFWKKLFEGKNPYPIEVEIHPSERCNLRCQFCPTLNNDYKDQDYYQELKNKIKDRKVILNKVKSLFKELASKGTKRIIFSGGKEPTLSPLILDLIFSAKKSGLEVKITTNGSGLNMPKECDGQILSKDNLFKFYAENLDRIHLSLNASNRETFNKVKGLNNDSVLFDQIVSNIKRIIFWRDKLRKEKKPSVEIYVAIVVDKENYKNLPNVIEFIKNLGSDIISINRYQYQMVEKKDIFNDKEMKDILRILKKIDEGWDSKKTRLIVSVEDLRNNYYKHILQLKTRCWVACCELTLNPVFLGLVCDTAAFPGREIFNGSNFRLGYIFDYPDFESYWNHTYEFRKGLSTDKCNDCRFCHKLLNAYVEKLYNDYQNGFKLEDQPFYSIKGS